jgi:predicted Zn-dependent peptidase
MTVINRAIPPIIRPIEAFPLPAPRRDQLSNGIPIFYFDNPNLDLIHLLVQVRTGSLYQPAKHICNFAYTLLRESSPRLTSQEMSEKLDYFGTNVTVNVGMENVQILISMPKNNLPEILPLIAECLITPKYNPENLRIMQNKEIKNLAYNEQKTDYRSWRILWREILGSHYPSVSEFASTETLNAVTIKQLHDFHRESFCAENITLMATGNMDPMLEQQLQDIWSAVPHGIRSAKLPLIPSPAKGGDLIYDPVPNCLQSSIVLFSPSIGYNDPDRTGFSVLNTLTGGYFSSRLMQNLRERQGLTYGISSASTFFGNQSVFTINSDVNVDQTQKALESCYEELQRLQEELVTEEELNMVKNYMAGILLRAVDTTVNAMQKFAYWYRFGLNETEMQRYFSEIKTITPEKIFFLAKKHFEYNKFTNIVVGNYLAKK